MKRMATIALTMALALLVSACSSQRELPSQSGGAAGDAGEIATQFLTAIGADDLETAKALLAQEVTFGALDGETQTLARPEMEGEIDRLSGLQQEYNQIVVEETGEGWANIRCFMPNYLTSMVFGMDREGYPCLVRIEVTGSKVSGMLTQQNPEAAAAMAEKTAASVGMTVEADPSGRVLVTAVEAGWPAALAGIQVGDELLAVNGLSVQQMRLAANEPQYRLMGTEGAQIAVTVLQGEEETNYTLTCETAE